VLDEPDVLGMLLPVLKADMEMFETYQYETGKPLQCPVYTIAGADDSLHPPSSMVDWQKETERDLHVTLHCFRWWLEERPDIGV